ncbi:OB-fold nucleic acid binding domain-containing protein [Colletotrichum tofieldiae]|uniref:CST complex subunit STN1 n=1 Tax=Colletotrichum tofieldiae TaxID=708197 RepID=A0A166X477_9PEZI|nr:OB-fold nucleic acid binding domain-containing protein [Colletotrichum tofieldiae]GKT86309.1 OB-fold nucleic acid binding domain-containing protein [Colletotrichum tofieldiae]
MTSDPSAGLYPRYCLHLSPTFNTWCLLHASDIHALKSLPEYEVQNFYFHRNLPIKWARIVGIVVAVDDFPGRRIYTVDDSSGACIECVVALKSPPSSDASAPKPNTNGWFSSNRPQPQPPADCVDVDVGSVVDVKGGLATFREEKQIKIEKLRILRSTEQEVALWERRTRFRNEVLLQPWVLSDKQIRRCKKEEMRDTTGDDGEERRRRKKRREESRKAEEEMRQKANAAAASAAAAAAEEDRYRAHKLKKGALRQPKPLFASAATSSTVEEDRYRAHKLRRSGARSSDKRTGASGGLLRQVLDDSIRGKVNALGL